MSSPNPKRLAFARLAAVARALGHEHRLELVEHLGQGERTVEALAARAGLEVANASQHLQALRRAGLVAARRDGRHVVYRLADERVIQIVEDLRHVAERHAADLGQAISKYFGERDAIAPVTQDELLARLRDGTVLLLDVRPQDEYDAGHLPGAVNVPWPTLARRLRVLPRRREIVAYCRGPYCVLSVEAAAALRARGYRVRRLETGFPQWKAAGLPVEAGA